MAERKATNKYYPPEWEPKHGSINTYRNSHPLRDRAKHLKSDGILIVRFALPFRIWCNACESILGEGTRFNAQKQRVQHVHEHVQSQEQPNIKRENDDDNIIENENSDEGIKAEKIIDEKDRVSDEVPTWQFTFKCPQCSHEIRIRTNVRDACYEVVDGARKRRDSEPDDRERDDVHRVMTSEQSMELASDPMRRLEVKRMDELTFGNGSDIHETLQRLQAVQETNWSNDFDNSYQIRRQHRQMRGDMVREEQRFDETYGNLRRDLRILPPSDRDESMAKQTCFYKQQQTGTPLTKQKKIAKINRMVNRLRSKNHIHHPSSLLEQQRSSSILDNVQIVETSASTDDNKSNASIITKNDENKTRASLVTKPKTKKKKKNENKNKDGNGDVEDNKQSSSSLALIASNY